MFYPVIECPEFLFGGIYRCLLPVIHEPARTALMFLQWWLTSATEAAVQVAHGSWIDLIIMI